MKISVSGSIKPIVMDLRNISRKMVPAATSRALNTVSRPVESKSVKALAGQKQIQSSVVRWHHTDLGERTKRRRLLKTSARKDRLWVGWRWATKSGEPGRVSVISLPGRRQTKSGVKAGRSGPVYKGGFIQTTKSGQLGAFTRLGKPRYPIRYLRIDMTDAADTIFVKNTKAAGPAFRKEFGRQLSLAMKKQRVAIVRRSIRASRQAVMSALQA